MLEFQRNKRSVWSGNIIDGGFLSLSTVVFLETKVVHLMDMVKFPANNRPDRHHM